MDWIQFILFCGGVFGMFFWNRSESRADHRHLEAMVNAQIEAIRQEIKDFHGRLERQDAEFKAHLMNHHKE
jgi:hypothetical protein